MGKIQNMLMMMVMIINHNHFEVFKMISILVSSLFTEFDVFLACFCSIN